MYCSDFVEMSSYHSACEHANAKGMSNTTPVVVAFTKYKRGREYNTTFPEL